MAASPDLLAVRFGTGRHPARRDPQSPDEMLNRLRGPDTVAARYPIDGFSVLFPLQTLVNDLSIVQRKNKGNPKGEEARLAKREVYKSERGRQIRMFARTTARWVESDDPLRERLTRFFADHFTTIGKAGILRRAVSLYVEDAIRPHVSGRFADLLRAAVLHPMMLVYLDQDRSAGPNSRMAEANPTRGLNENLAREVLELHTLGVDGPYTQEDVRQLAELLAGATVKRAEGFRFSLRQGEPGPETVLGVRYGGKKPSVEDIYAVLDDLAAHPATARHLARKLAVHFVSDTPPEDLVAAVAARFQQSDGDIPAVMEALMTHPAATSLPLSKAKQPFEFIATSLRALAVPGDHIVAAEERRVLQFLANPMARMGQRLENPTGPDGWPEDAAHWITPQGLAMRIDWALRVRRLTGNTLPDPEGFVDQALGSLASDRLRFAVGASEARTEAIGLVLASPEFQRR